MPSVRTLFVAVLILLAGCTGPSVTEPTPTPTATPTATPTSTATTTDGGGTQTEWTVTVVHVVDGDTLEVRFPDGHTEDVRLLGVDTPEVHVQNDPAEFEGIPQTRAGSQWLRDWGERASQFATDRLAGKQVTVRTDPMADRRGGYGRLLVHVYVNGEDFNHDLIAQGYARMYDSQFEKRDTYASTESTAQSNDVGLWAFGDGGTQTPDGGDGGLSLAEIHADAAGKDHLNRNGEYLVFENAGDSTLDLSGATVSDAAGHTYHVPSGVVLDAGERVTLYTGSGDDSDAKLYWGADGAIWNNGGDTITVTAADGAVLLREGY